MSAGRRFLRLCARLAWWLVCVGFGLAVMHVAVSLAGAVATTLLLTFVLLMGGIGAWAEYVEPRVFAPRSADSDAEFVVVVDQRVAAEQDHVEFARALSAVADAYLVECERRAGLADGDRFR
jgi:hypothetical protein